ncbi:MAG TPA: D-glycero-beta-D-manno-heptose 1-phosphate adenylyltransferase [Candidatus Hydrogenedentes bacterium]|nr:D-glycero-beta-D-manno-heptose 1-phosphate adenylyltransferase [Candidatus Hydrogenedentota bacterium]HOV76011.1 D-glycero-beta-D-manno-heptose 1-phosphate adenylyltransferase [Candidatus Hydrogenedentota bacterium]HPC15885.1 D-glycero-beta-D-manno-heptose 1-phosphate adenylyltransferase [Candidatus Hydrogenedentota bacterium]HRT19839.1 D-glycero-beta-D-manno-heptose 1-phosphate adenylyltransferase [Candidatus Hydrogenedentota bacterium]HRT65419.1 D-glycero-beta-D-manno-heptose 1-phosphate a
MTQTNYRELLARFETKRVLVVGDIYLDENVFGIVTGISLEAPIPIFEVQERKHNPGAAGNAACNVAALGAKTYMIGVVGNDSNADIVRKEFAVRNVDTSGVVTDPGRPTNTYGKLRAGGHNTPTQEVLRTDTPAPVFISGDVEEQVVANIRARAPEVDAIMVGDQVSSVVTERVIAEIVACARKHKLLTVADSRKRASAFKDFDLVTPNDREAGLATGVDVRDEASLMEAGRKLLSFARNAMITRGPDGITIFAQDGSVETVPILPCDVVDVTGAGDTVTAAVTLTMLAGGTLRDAAFVGNAAAGVAVAQKGVVTVTREETLRAIEGAKGPAKLKTLDELAPVVQRLQMEGKTVVWTNGCFDILHVGHITYLQKAAKLGDVLVVGLNSDASVRENKGPTRPVVNEADRALVLSALACVDYLVIFGDKTTVRFLEALKPDVYAKGGDYTLETIVQEERRVVEGYGGRIAIIPGVEGQSTTAIIERIVQG